MATRISARYTGELRTELVHEQSGARLITDAPTDNHGKGEAFSPTDLLAAATLSCMLTVIGIAEQNDQLPKIAAMRGSVEKHMGSSPRHVERLAVELELTGVFSDDEKRRIEQLARHCPVTNSFPDSLEIDLDLKFLSPTTN